MRTPAPQTRLSTAFKAGLALHLVALLGCNGSSGPSGATGSGGATASGGASASGGTKGSGGAPASGGATGSGGATASGGTSGSGGVTASGGATGSGGAMASGGATGSGGSASGGEPMLGTGGAAGRGGGGRGGNSGSAGEGGAQAGGRQGMGGTSPSDGGADDVVTHDGAVTDAGAFVPTGWTAVYTCTGTCPAQMSQDMADMDTARAFDGMLGTRWSTGQYQQSTALMSKFPLYFTVDMKQVMNVSKVTLNPGTKDMYDAPGQMDVLVSLDGTTFTTVVSAHKPSSPSMGNTDTIMFPAATAARFIQLKATMTIKQVNSSLGDRYWAIGEMNVFP